MCIRDSAGEATFNDDINLHDGKRLRMGTGGDFEIFHDGSDNIFKGASSDQDMKFNGVDGGSEITALLLDMSAAGQATFNSGANFGGASQISTADNSDTLTLLSTDADDNSGPNLRMYRNSGSPADNDVIGQIQFEGRNDNSQDVVYNDISMKIADASDGTEDGIIRFRNMQAGTLRQYLSTSGTEVVINEDSVDLDFRVESNGSANCLFVNGGTNRVGVGTNAPADTMHIKSTGDPSGDIRLILETNATDGNCAIDFRNSAGTFKGGILYDTDDNDLKFFTNGSNERMRIEGTGKIGINTTNTGTAMLKVNIPDSQYGFETIPAVNQTYYAAIFRNSSGNDVGRIESTASATSFVTSSDYRLKENVSYDFDATTRLKQLKPSRFNFINTPDTTVDGFLAHEVSSIVPEAISGEKDKTETYTDDDGQQQTRPVYQGIDQSKLVPLLVKTIQELEARITTLEG